MPVHKALQLCLITLDEFLCLLHTVCLVIQQYNAVLFHKKYVNDPCTKTVSLRLSDSSSSKEFLRKNAHDKRLFHV